MSKSNYCSNCGKFGHVFKKCTEPTTSLGIICFKFTEDLKVNKSFFNEFVKKKYLKIDEFNFNHLNNLLKIDYFKNKIKFLLIRRKHSLNFIEFIRGRYKINDLKRLVNMFELMSNEEINLIRNNDFDFLWKNLWKKTSKYKMFQKEFNKSKKLFEQLKKNGILEKLVEINSLYDSPEWGLPKGRRNNFEKNIDCAKREFYEETNIENNKIVIFNNIHCLHENYKGNNNVNYRHIYYVSHLDEEVDIYNYNNIEVSKIGWFTWEEAVELIRPYYKEKIEIINKVFMLTMNLFCDCLKENREWLIQN